MKDKKYKYFIFLLLFVFILTLSIGADNIHDLFKQAVDQYTQGNWNSSKNLFEKIYLDISLKNSYSFEVVYNLANVNFRENKLGFARYWYEIAKLYNYYDNDLIYNLKYVKRLVGDLEQENIILLLYRSLSFEHLYLLLFLFNLFFFVMSVFILIANNSAIKKIRNISAVFLIILIFWFFARYIENNNTYGIITESSVLSSAPEDVVGVKSVSVNEGKKVLVISEKDNYYAVFLPVDKIQGWIKKDYIKLIKS